MTKRIVVLISGSGSNLQAMIDAQQNNELGGDIVAVFSNRPNVLGLERASKAGIPAETLDHKSFDSREAFDTELAKRLDEYNPDLVVLAGFMRILTPEFVNHYAGKLLNIHPSLLPKYPGLNTHQRAIEAGDQEHGATVHFVTPELDGGPPLVQGKIAIENGDTPNSLQQRIHIIEHKIYPLAVRWCCEGKAELTNQGAVLNGELLPEYGWCFKDPKE